MHPQVLSIQRAVRANPLPVEDLVVRRLFPLDSLLSISPILLLIGLIIQ